MRIGLHPRPDTCRSGTASGRKFARLQGLHEHHKGKQAGAWTHFFKRVENATVHCSWPEFTMHKQLEMMMLVVQEQHAPYSLASNRCSWIAASLQYSKNAAAYSVNERTGECEPVPTGLGIH